MTETSIARLILWEPVEGSMKPLQNNQSQRGGDRVKADEDIIEALMMAHEIRPERYTILGNNGISKEAAYELAYRTEVI